MEVLTLGAGLSLSFPGPEILESWQGPCLSHVSQPESRSPVTMGSSEKQDSRGAIIPGGSQSTDWL